ncbi:hypothetical protein EZS27_041320, partial [termite gut metagenome]
MNNNSNENEDINELSGEIEEQHSPYQQIDLGDENIKHQLTGMYHNWFLDYASYVILERAV